MKNKGSDYGMPYCGGPYPDEYMYPPGSMFPAFPTPSTPMPHYPMPDMGMYYPGYYPMPGMPFMPEMPVTPGVPGLAGIEATLGQHTEMLKHIEKRVDEIYNICKEIHMKLAKG